MADAPVESPTQEKARLRRERRAAKITSGGASRLQAITSLQGGPPRELHELQKDVPAKPQPSQPVPAHDGTSTPDPEEVDISQHHYTPASQPRLPSPFALDANSPFPAGQPGDPAQDPMMAMLQQMMGAAGGGGMPGGPPGQGGPQPGQLPPGLDNLFAAMQGGSEPEPSPEQSSAWLWRLVHSLFSLGLAIYIVLQTPFTGSKHLRTSPAGDEDWTLETPPSETFAHFFYLFATFEVVLQSSRYFIERGQLQGSGFLSSIGRMLPEPYAGYVRMIGRYSVIYSTVVSDAMVVVFVLGAASWWRGGAAV